MEISHLQFVDDAFDLLSSKKQVLINYRRLLDCFSIMTCLNINYSKYALIPLGCEEGLVDEIGRELRCFVVALLITYLGIPFGENPRKEKNLETCLGES